MEHTMMPRITTMKATPKFSSTVTSALAGALFVGLATAVVYALALAPMGGFPFGFAEIALYFVLGAVFGTIAGGVAGASEVESAPQPLHEPAMSPVVTVRA
jgi:hypothetical protein